MDFNSIAKTDMTDRKIKLSEELDARLREYMVNMELFIDDVAAYLYGPNYTPEERDDASIAMLEYTLEFKFK